uniref:Murine leukemia virus integrase C-terminal domain-containing protein n=1 Tax=Salmo trutta TaxID=8032 RepID=A0A674B227_SALTR
GEDKQESEGKNFPRHVYLKVHQPASLEPRWTGPHTILLVNDMAVKLTGKKAWIHVSQFLSGGAQRNPVICTEDTSLWRGRG